MTDVLDRPETNRIVGRLRRRTVALERNVPPALDDPKELFVMIRSMVADDCIATNISRAVVRFVNTYEAEPPRVEDDEFAFDEVGYLWIAESDQLSRPNRIWTTPQTSFLDNANRLDKRGQTDAALDIIFDQIDETLLSGEFDRVDRILVEITPDDFSVELLLGLLTVTLPAKNRLCNRASFFKQVRHSLHERGETDEGLLVGLD